MEYQKTSGKCCICGKALQLNPNGAPKMDEVARYCTECGTDICVFCLQKLTSNGMEKICPVCGKAVVFEINPLFRPKK